MVNFISDDLVFAKADIIVNASNGCGYMGGRKCSKTIHKGVAEHLNFVTDGKIEKASLIQARKYKHISSWIFGKKSGDIFITNNFGLNCKEVVHAVTMRYPGMLSKIKNVELAIQHVFDYCQSKGYSHIAMPLLGTGTGKLDEQTVIQIIEKSQLYIH